MAELCPETEYTHSIVPVVNFNDLGPRFCGPLHAILLASGETGVVRQPSPALHTKGVWSLVEACDQNFNFPTNVICGHIMSGGSTLNIDRP